MNELGTLILGLLCGGALGWWAHTAVWAIRDARALRRWDADAPALRPIPPGPALYGLPSVHREPVAWRERIAQAGIYDYPAECEESGTDRLGDSTTRPGRPFSEEGLSR